MKRTRTSPAALQKQEMALEIMSSDAYLTINKKMLQAFGPEVTIFLSNLIDKFRHFRQVGKLTKDNAFFLTYQQQSEQTGMSVHQLRKCKKTLIEKGILWTEKRGVPAKEFYWIDFELLAQEWLDINPDCLGQEVKDFKDKTSGSLRTIYKENKYKENKYNNIPRPEGLDSDSGGKENKSNGNHPKEPKGGTVQERNKQYLPIAKKLSGIIQEQKNIHHTSSQLKSWSSEIRKLVENNKVDVDRINNLLDWYQNNAGGEYIPVVESGSTLRNKFTRLEAAMERKSKPYTNGQPKPTKPPEDIIDEAFESKGWRKEYRKFLEQIEDLGINKDEELSEAIKNLIETEQYIRKHQDTNGPRKDYTESPLLIIERYLAVYLPKQTWIDNPGAWMFSHKNKIFRQFVQRHQEEVRIAL